MPNLQDACIPKHTLDGRIEGTGTFRHGLSIASFIHNAYREGRCFSFLPDPGIVHRLRRGTDVRFLWKRYLDLVTDIYYFISQSAREIGNVKEVPEATRLLLTILHLAHQSIADLNEDILMRQRIVAVQPDRQHPVIHHVYLQRTALQYCNGRQWTLEIPTVYFDMRLFSILLRNRKNGRGRGIFLFKLLLVLEKLLMRAGSDGFTQIPHLKSASIRRLAAEASLTEIKPLHVVERSVIETAQTIL